MSDLCTLVYVSTASQLMSDEQLQAMLKKAMARNHINGLTGVLLYDEGNFMQCLEGPRSAVLETYGRIKANPAHRGVTELLLEPIAARSFEGWDMDFLHSSPSEMQALSQANWWRLRAEADRADDSPGLILLRDFWRSARKQPG